MSAPDDTPMLDRRSFLAGAISVIATPLVLEAQPPPKVALVGVLWPLSDHPYLEAFRQGLRDHGYTEGQNIRLEYRYARGDDSALPGLASELVGLKVDIILTWGTPAAGAAKDATKTIPIVMGAIGDPIAAGIVTRLARPGGNITGLTSIAVELEEKRIELLKEVAPKTSRVAVLWNPTNTFSALALKQAQAAADRVHVKLQPVGVRLADDFPKAFTAVTRQRPDALMVHGDPFLFTHVTRIVEFAVRSRLPAIYGWRDFTDAGGLMAYAPNYTQMFRRAGLFVDKILKGARPGDLAIEQPTNFELVINLKTAKALGLAVPQSILLRADEVIQ